VKSTEKIFNSEIPQNKGVSVALPPDRYPLPRLQIPPLLNRREASNFFDIREILKKKEAATDTPPLYFSKNRRKGGGSIHRDIN
jgi:hypothetical protein